MDSTAFMQVQKSSPTYQIHRNKVKSLGEKVFTYLILQAAEMDAALQQ